MEEARSSPGRRRRKTEGERQHPGRAGGCCRHRRRHYAEGRRYFATSSSSSSSRVWQCFLSSDGRIDSDEVTLEARSSLSSASAPRARDDRAGWSFAANHINQRTESMFMAIRTSDEVRVTAHNCGRNGAATPCVDQISGRGRRRSVCVRLLEDTAGVDPRALWCWREDRLSDASDTASSHRV